MPFVQFGVNRKCQHLRIIDQVIHLYADHLFHLFNFSRGSKTIPSFIGTGFQSACWCRINPRRPSLANRRQTTRTSLTSLSYFLAIFIILRHLHHTSTSSSYIVAIIIGAQTLVSCAQNKDAMENLQPRVESLYFCYKIQLKKKDNMCVWPQFLGLTLFLNGYAPVAFVSVQM